MATNNLVVQAAVNAMDSFKLPEVYTSKQLTKSSSTIFIIEPELRRALDKESDKTQIILY